MIAFNLPGITNFTLTRSQIVGIYNGTYQTWDDPVFKIHNPDAIFPSERITPVARADNSGTTEIFTSALSSFSSPWLSTFGTFSEGLDEDGVTPLKWDPTVVKTFARRIYGVTDLISDTQYSVGYTSLHLAQQVDLTYASIINRAGATVRASEVTVQAAMDVSSDQMSNRLTVSMVDVSGLSSYPIVGYTYMIVHKETMQNCDSAVELARYIEWFLTKSQPREEASQLSMIPVSDKIADKVYATVLKNMYCRDRRVLSLLSSQKSAEAASLETWRTPVKIVVPIVAILIMGLITYMVFQRVKFNKMLNRNDWDISVDEITFYLSNRTHSNLSRSGSQRSTLSHKSLSVDPNQKEAISINTVLQWPGKWSDYNVSLNQLIVPEYTTITRNVRKDLMWMKHSINNENIVRLFGLTMVENGRFLVREFCSKGALNDILQEEKYNLNLGFKFSLASDVANGMAFLHRRGIIHGSLRSSCCLLDTRWTVKICEWEYVPLFNAFTASKAYQRMETANKSVLVYIRKYIDSHGEHAVAFRDLWTAPELLKSKYELKVTQGCDVYSFSIILQEIFTRNDPYCEVTGAMDIIDVLQDIELNGLRPEHADDTPVKVRQIMEIAWSEEPMSRPSFDQICKMLRLANVNKRSVLDNIMEAMEEYSQHLEEKIEEKNNELTTARENAENLLAHVIPRSLAHNILKGQCLSPQSFETVSVLLVRIHSFGTVTQRGTVSDVIHLLEQFDKLVDQLLQKRDEVFKIESRVGEVTFVAGLPCRKLIKHAGLLAPLALELMALSRNLQEFLVDETHKNRTLTDFVPASADNREQLVIQPQLEMVLHSGSLSAGLIGESVPKLVVYGEALETAEEMLKSTKPGHILLSSNARKILQRIGCFQMSPIDSDNIKVYHHQHHHCKQ